jgi:hypothetical protein
MAGENETTTGCDEPEKQEREGNRIVYKNSHRMAGIY